MDPYSTTDPWAAAPGTIAPADGNYANAVAADGMAGAGGAPAMPKPLNET